jgi:hypothetical protein
MDMHGDSSPDELRKLSCAHCATAPAPVATDELSRRRWSIGLMQTVDYRTFINRDLPMQDRGCGSKAVFISRREAKSFVRRGGYPGLEPYRCRFCPHWHVGHRRRRR